MDGAESAIRVHDGRCRIRLQDDDGIVDRDSSRQAEGNRQAEGPADGAEQVLLEPRVIPDILAVHTTSQFPRGTYTIMRLGGRDVGACYAMGPHEQGIPPHWNSYVAVASADEAAKKTADLGGQVLGQPFDVFESGRMAILQDPAGAVFCVWQAKKHPGVTRIDEPGALCWTELATTDTKKAGAFSVPPNWTPYFAVSDCDATATRATQLGGSLRVPPSDIPNVGRFSVIQDPQGAVFAIVKITAV